MVVDSSALVEALAVESPNAEWEHRLRSEADIHAPHLVDLEFASALRGLIRGGKVTDSKANGALDDLADLRLVRYPHEPFLERIWTLTPNLTAYDAAYVALAETLEMPLVTADARLARASGHTAEIELL